MHSRVSKTHSQCLQKCYIFAGSHFLVQQRVCDNQDFVKTEQLKAYSRVLQTHVHVIGDAKRERSPRRLGQMSKLTMFIHHGGMCKECCKFIFFSPREKKKCPRSHGLRNDPTPAVKNILQERTVFIKADPFLRKIHFKKVKKDHEEKMLSFFFFKKRKRIKTKTFLNNKQKKTASN